MGYTNNELRYAMEIDIKKKRNLGKKIGIRKKYSRSQNDILNQKTKYLLFKKNNKPVYNSNPIPFNL